VDKDLTDKSLLFFNVSTGYKQGGVFAGIPPNNSYRPETMLAYEVGSKNRFFDDDCRSTSICILYNYKDYQVDSSNTCPWPNGRGLWRFYNNAAKATQQGRGTHHRVPSDRSRYADSERGLSERGFKDFLYPLPPDFSAPPSTVYTYQIYPVTPSSVRQKWTGTVTYQHIWPCIMTINWPSGSKATKSLSIG